MDEHCEGCKGWNCSNCEERHAVQAGGDIIDVEMYQALVKPKEESIDES